MPDSGFLWSLVWGVWWGGLCRGDKRWEAPLVCWAGVAGLERLPVLRTGPLVEVIIRAHSELVWLSCRGGGTS